MTTIERGYRGDDDFRRIRAFLIETHGLYKRPLNWQIDRWNFCRYHVIPLHNYYNVNYFGVPVGTESHRDELPLWEQTIRIWENAAGDIVGVIHSENEEAGEAWVESHPAYAHLYPEMITAIETYLTAWIGDVGFVKLYIDDGDEKLEQEAANRGYRKLTKQPTPRLVYRLENLPPVTLPDGFMLRSVADENDIEQRRRAKALSFGRDHNPVGWPPAAGFEAMQRAPDYRPELDLFIVAPDGEYAAFGTIWLDEQNKYGNFEPVGTHYEYQGLGLGRSLLNAGFHRMAQRGIERSYMDTGIGFYRKIGFESLPYTIYPWIKYMHRS